MKKDAMVPEFTMIVADPLRHRSRPCHDTWLNYGEARNAIMTVVETERLIIRHLVPADLDDLARIQSDPEVMHYFATGVRALDQTAADIARCQSLQDEYGYSLWATILKQNGQFLGRCGLLPQEINGQREVEIAYLIARSHWGQGLATEAATAIRDLGAQAFHITRFVSIIHTQNVASRRVAEKVGMRRERLIQFLDMKCWLYATGNPLALAPIS